MTYLEIPLLFGASLLAGAVNAVAGGGTFLIFPLLMSTGLSALSANIMSTITVWPGTLASIYGYRKLLTGKRSYLPMMLAMGLLGGIIGAWLLISTPELTFRHMLPWLLLIATMVFTFGRNAIAWFTRSDRVTRRRMLLGLCIQLVIAIYGGYFGAGMGILTLAMLQLIGFSDIHEMNALKTVITGAINAVAIVVFIASGKVIWSLALVMGSGAFIGGYLGARLGQRVPPRALRWFVSLVGFAMTAYFFLTRA